MKIRSRCDQNNFKWSNQINWLIKLITYPSPLVARSSALSRSASNIAMRRAIFLVVYYDPMQSMQSCRSVTITCE